MEFFGGDSHTRKLCEITVFLVVVGSNKMRGQVNYSEKNSIMEVPKKCNVEISFLLPEHDEYTFRVLLIDIAIDNN